MNCKEISTILRSNFPILELCIIPQTSLVLDGRVNYNSYANLIGDLRFDPCPYIPINVKTAEFNSRDNKVFRINRWPAALNAARKAFGKFTHRLELYLKALVFTPLTTTPHQDRLQQRNQTMMMLRKPQPNRKLHPQNLKNLKRTLLTSKSW